MPRIDQHVEVSFDQKTQRKMDALTRALEENNRLLKALADPIIVERSSNGDVPEEAGN